MPQDYNNLLAGLRVQSQIPLDVKNWIASENSLSNLGVSNNLAFTYVKGMIIYCVQEGTRWEWKPSTEGIGLLTQDFTYPANIITFGINYSNQTYNFYKVFNSSQVNSDWNSTSGLSQILNKPAITAQVNSDWNSVSGISQILNKPTFKTINGSSIIGLGNIAISTGVASITGTAVNNNDPLNPVINVNGSETKVNAGTNITISGDGTISTPYVINATDTNTTYSAGEGLLLSGTTFNINNLQKVITYPADFVGTNYTLINLDNNYEIIINNGATAITITVPSGLTSKIGVGFTQKGAGDVSYVSSGTTINNPIGLKIKGQFYQTYLSQELNTNNYFLGGNTKI
jgi:hypothetical protein